MKITHITLKRFRIISIIPIILLLATSTWVESSHAQTKKLLLIYMNDNPENYSRMGTLVRKQKAVLDKCSSSQLPDNLSQYAGIIFLVGDAQSSFATEANIALTALRKYVKSGGVLFISFRNWLDKTNELVMEYFELALNTEVVLQERYDRLFFDGEFYFNDWKGLKVGGWSDATGDLFPHHPQIPGYFDYIGTSGSPNGRPITSSTTGKKRNLSFIADVGKGRVITIIEASLSECGYCGQSIFHDKLIGILDNEDAITLLVKNLLLGWKP